MIKRTLKRLTSVLLVAALVIGIGCATTQVEYNPTVGDMHISNNSDCLLFAVMIVEIVINPVTRAYTMDLVHAEWLPVGAAIDVELKIGHLYGILVEGYFFNKSDPMKATALAGQRYKQGIFTGKDQPTIVLNCIHTEPKEL